MKYYRKSTKKHFSQNKNAAMAVKKFVHCINARVVLMLILFSAISGFIFEMNRLSTKGFTIKEFEQQKIVLQQEMQQIQLRLAELQSLSRIQKEVAKSAWSPTKDIRYISADEDAVAKK